MVLKGVVQLLPLFLLMLLGIVLGKKGLVTADFRRQLTDFCFLILFPASVVTSFEGMELSGDTLINSGKLVLAGGIWVMLPFLAALAVTRWMKLDYPAANVVVFSMAYNNFGFAGLGMVSSLYSSQGLLYANMMGLGYRLTNMPLGIWIMERGRKGSSGSLWATVKTPPVVALLVMIPVALLGVPVPQVIYDTADMLNACLAPLGMVITGLAISDFSLPRLVRGRACYVVSFCRLVVTPLILAAAMLALGVRGEAFSAPLLVGGMPVAANCALMAEKYDADSRLAAQCVLISTLLSLATIPVLLALGGAAA